MDNEETNLINQNFYYQKQIVREFQDNIKKYLNLLV